MDPVKIGVVVHVVIFVSRALFALQVALSHTGIVGCPEIVVDDDLFGECT